MFWTTVFIFFIKENWKRKRKRGQAECDVTWFCFCFDFVRSHLRGVVSIVCWSMEVYLHGWRQCVFMC